MSGVTGKWKALNPPPTLSFPRFDGEKIELVMLIDGVCRTEQMTIAGAINASALFATVAAQAIAARGY